MDFLLVHPPLLGPAVWGPCAERLTALGHSVTVPDLRAAFDPPPGWPERAAAAAAAATAATAATPAATAGAAAIPAATAGAAAIPAATAAAAATPAATAAAAATPAATPVAVGHLRSGVGAGGVVLAGHSGAGVVLPLVADGLGDVAAVVFVDAVLPAAAGATAPSERFRAFLDGLPLTDGRLPRWSEWWGPEVMAEQVPDDDLRARIEAEQPRLPRAFYAEAAPVPASWPPARVAYLQLSPAYDAEAAQAAGRGWPVRSRPGRHLDLATHPAEVAADLLALTGRPDPRAGSAEDRPDGITQVRRDGAS